MPVPIVPRADHADAIDGAQRRVLAARRRSSLAARSAKNTWRSARCSSLAYSADEAGALGLQSVVELFFFTDASTASMHFIGAG